MQNVDVEYLKILNSRQFFWPRSRLLAHLFLVFLSGEEPHVSSAHAIVRVPGAREYPLGPGLSTAVSAEEVEENRCVQWLDGLLAKVVVVGIDLVAAVVVRALRVCVHHARVTLRELEQAL